jgi:tetratricopeptide (TPR) repeat protein
MVAALPAFFVLVEMSYGSRRQGGVAALAAMMLAAAVALVRIPLAPATDSVAWHGGIDKLLSAAPALGHFARVLLLPLSLSIWPDVDQSALSRFLAWIVLAVLCGAALNAFGKLRLGFWFLASLVLMLPSFALFTGAEAAADRRLYLPMLAIAAVAGRFLESTSLPALLAAGPLLLAGLTYSRAQVWTSEVARWEEAAQEAPSQLRPRLELAQRATPRRALELLLEAKAKHPDNALVAARLGDVYLALHLPGDAVREFGRALALKPGVADVHLSRGWALTDLQLYDAALTDFETALAIHPCSAGARAALHLPMPETCQK